MKIYIILIIALITIISCEQIESKKNIKLNVSSEMVTQSVQLSDTTVLFLWTDIKYDTILNDYINAIFLNEQYIKVITDPERATIGYVSTFIGNECWWDGKPKIDRTNLDCKILTALDLGYQCSDKHLGFLRYWFSKDKIILNKLRLLNCPTTPYTSTIQNTFDEITLTVTGDTISLYMIYTEINFREQKSSKWAETNYFKLTDKNLILVKEEKLNLNKKNIL